MTNKTLSDKRMELFRKMCKILPDFKWGLLFEEIQNQDKEFIKQLKEEYPCVMKKRKCIEKYKHGSWINCTNCQFKFKIDKIFGDKLTK